MDFGSGLSREEVIDRAGRLRDRVSALGGDSVEILAVTKGFGSEVMKLAYECGFRNVGESYAQELTAKWSDLTQEERDSIKVHFIGKMQTNKVRSRQLSKSGKPSTVCRWSKS